jgi:hypothetical protein
MLAGKDWKDFQSCLRQLMQFLDAMPLEISSVACFYAGLFIISKRLLEPYLIQQVNPLLRSSPHIMLRDLLTQIATGY